MKDFPETFLRGISQKNGVNLDDDVVYTHVFHFGQKTKTQDRNDSFNEESINWEDDDGVREFTRKQKNDKGLMFKGGVAVLNLSIIETIRRMPGIDNKFDAERSPLDDNPYHGNLLLDKKIPDKKMKQIAATIALAVQEILPPFDES